MNFARLGSKYKQIVSVLHFHCYRDRWPWRNAAEGHAKIPEVPSGIMIPTP